MKYLGLDWGLKKIGLAISEGEVASPLDILSIPKNSLQEVVAKVVAVAKEKNIEQMVIGKPEGEIGRMVEKVATKLKKEGLRVVLTDETLSTREAKEVMLRMGIRQKARRQDNAMAAAIILQRYLDEKS